jgi:hypothetical protein
MQANKHASHSSMCTLCKEDVYVCMYISIQR